MKPTFSALVLVFFTVCAYADPCTGVDRTLTEAQKVLYTSVIGTHLNKQLGPDVHQKITLTTADVFQQFRVGKWHIVYVNTGVSDEPFLFYDRPPSQAKAYLTAWGGGAARNEGPYIHSWLRKEAPGIPSLLANCFVYHITQDRDM